MDTDDDNEEYYGDASFLANVDLDAVTLQAQPPPVPPPQQQQMQMQQQQQIQQLSHQNPYKRSASSSSSSRSNDRNASMPPPATAMTESAPPRVSFENDENAPSQVSLTNHNIDNKKKKCKTNTSEEALVKTLRDDFGYDAFRTGQVEVVQSVLQGRDASVYWATGQGKSLCYQLPALHSDTITIVVSPLIALMQDQCHKLNGRQRNEGADHQVATYLGSAQMDATQETRALAGEFLVVYVTPEKLTTNDFIDGLARLHQRNDSNNGGSGSKRRRKIGLLAVDEAHCCSEWGHDFRPAFRRIAAFRQHAALSQVPILTLTATAVPRVRRDLEETLQLQSPLVSAQSLDRPNLQISATEKAGKHPVTHFQDLLTTLRNPTTRLSEQSTLVYCPTRNDVDTLAAFFQQHLADTTSRVRVGAYHAGMSPEDRQEAHTSFLTGQTTVLVATVAFGMGIDKEDTRRIIHYGAPKTMEEYYQQIGRAGRDGRLAHCTLYASAADYDRYQSDFYLQNLSGEAKAATLASLAALKTYGLEREKCRRAALLRYFDQVPPFGDRCGTCDNCRSSQKYGADGRRDLRQHGGLYLLTLVQGMPEQSTSTLLKVAASTSNAPLESYRYKRGSDRHAFHATLGRMKNEIPAKYPVAYYRELLGALEQAGYLQMTTKLAEVSGFSRTWTVYNLTQKGREALDDNHNDSPVVVTVPEYLRDLERKQEERRQAVITALEQSPFGDRLPQDEVAAGDGPAVRAYSKWHSYVQQAEKKEGGQQRVDNLNKLLQALEAWRSRAAVEQQMAPAAVLAEHVLVSLAYAVATNKPGVIMDAEALRAAGVRSRMVDALALAISDWVSKAQPALKEDDSKQTAKTQTMQLTSFQPAKPWEFAVYKPNKKTGKAVWELSYDRFVQGQDPSTIAMAPSDGRGPIQVATVVGHLLDALVQGRGVDLKRLGSNFPTPTREHWDAMEAAEAEMEMNVLGDPNTSGKGGGFVAMTDLMRPIVGNHVCDIPGRDRSEEDKALLAPWFDRLKWYMALKRAGYEPEFGHDQSAPSMKRECT